MTREEVCNEYHIDASGRIRSPGRFEGEMLYVPAIFDIVMNGLADGDSGDEAWVRVDQELKQQFPELRCRMVVCLSFSNSGFVSEV